jgi:PPOX class probable F420-dependent enzyme
MNLSIEDAKARLTASRVARLATADEDGQPHVVTFVYAVGGAGGAGGDWIYHAVDHKPKRTTDLKRMRNIRLNPLVSVLVDHYEDDWERLWWVRADGQGSIIEGDAERAEPVRLLMAKYPQYQERPPAGPVIAVQVMRWSGWSYSDTGGGTSIS